MLVKLRKKTLTNNIDILLVIVYFIIVVGPYTLGVWPFIMYTRTHNNASTNMNSVISPPPSSNPLDISEDRKVQRNYRKKQLI